MINFSELLWKPRTRHLPASTRTETLSTATKAAELSMAMNVTAEVTPESRIILATDPGSPGADRFRLLRMRLKELRAAADVRTVLVTSPLPQDGKSTVALNLATALAEGGKRAVLLIEADLHHPSLAQSLKLEKRPGFCECVADGLPPLSVVQRVNPLGWYLMQAGTAPANPSDLLQNAALPGVMQTLSDAFDWVVIDTPPVVLLSDAISLGVFADTSLLVVRSGVTPQPAVKEAMRLLGAKHVLGILFNCEQVSSNRYTRYSDYYRSSPQQPEN